MKYTVSIQSIVVVDAKTPKEAADQVNDVLEDACKQNCGDIGDEILANSTIAKIKIEKYNDK